MRKTKNETHIEGLLYQHNLSLKTSSETSKNPGTQYISGTIDIATDDECLNIVSVHYTYVTPTTASGKTDSRYAVLMDILSGNFKNVVSDGVNKAAKLSVESAIGLNEFYSDRNGEYELVSQKRNEGGFIRIASQLNANEAQRNTFRTDMIITGVTHIDADEDSKTEEKAVVKGYIFDFRQALLPVEYVAINPKAIAYFEGLDASNMNPIFTQVRGQQVSMTIVSTVTEENAFDVPEVREVKRTRREFVITAANPEVYPWDEEGSITAMEVRKLLTDRETYLATLKKRQEDYKNSVANAPSAFASVPVESKETFKF